MAMLHFRAIAGAFALVAAFGGCARHGASAPDFTLRDDAGQTWALSSQRGKAVLLTFGFTHCADTCPATIAKLVRLSDGLGARAGDVEIVMVTVDPQRDTPPAMHRFLARFDSPRVVGLTGSPAQIDAVERAYHVWAQRIPGAHGAAAYDVAHSAVIFFVDRNGHIAAIRDDG